MNYSKEDLKTIPWRILMQPRRLDDMCLPARIADKVREGIYENFLFYGNAGIGKSQLAKVITIGANCMYINGSVDGNISELRDRMKAFAMERSIDFGTGEQNSNTKVIFIDEVDGGSAQFFKGLRGFMDEFDKVRYICTANYLNKVPEPIQSRFKLFDFNLQDESEVKSVKSQYAKRIKHVIKASGIKYDSGEDAKKAIMWLLQKEFPDFRGILQALQSLYISGLGLSVANIMESRKANHNELFELVLGEKGPADIHKVVMESYQNDVPGALASLGNEFIDYLIKNHHDKVKFIPNTIVKVADYQSKLPAVIDPTICLKACIYDIQLLLRN